LNFIQSFFSSSCFYFYSFAVSLFNFRFIILAISMSLKLVLPVLAVVLAISFPVARAEQICSKNIFGDTYCHTKTTYIFHIIASASITVTVIIILVIAAVMHRRRQKAADAMEAIPTMRYGPSLGATIPSNYDPNPPQYPTQSYPFSGFGRTLGGHYGAGLMIPPAPLYPSRAPPESPYMRQSV
jgi:hypothetical protein